VVKTITLNKNPHSLWVFVFCGTVKTETHNPPMKNFATIISLVVALIVVQPQKVEAQTLQQQGASLSFSCAPGVSVNLTNASPSQIDGYTKYYLCFTSAGVPSNLSTHPALDTPVMDQAFICKKGVTFQLRIIQYGNGSQVHFVAEQVDEDVAVASNEMIVRIK
jgi:SNF family Na+-dependent transporter